MSTLEWAFWSMLICIVGPLVVAAGVLALFGLPPLWRINDND